MPPIVLRNDPMRTFIYQQSAKHVLQSTFVDQVLSLLLGIGAEIANSFVELLILLKYFNQSLYLYYHFNMFYSHMMGIKY